VAKKSTEKNWINEEIRELGTKQKKKYHFYCELSHLYYPVSKCKCVTVANGAGGRASRVCYELYANLLHYWKSDRKYHFCRPEGEEPEGKRKLREALSVA
jgi:hypothetical protein